MLQPPSNLSIKNISTGLNKPTDFIAFYDSSIERSTVPDTDLNLVKYSNYILNATPMGVVVYDEQVDYLGLIDLAKTSCIDVNSDTLYIGTTNSGIYEYNLELLSSGIYNEYYPFKQEPDITSNEVLFISCTDTNVLATTSSGINYYDMEGDEWYKCYSDEEIGKCWQAEDGCIYYVSRSSEGTFYDHGSYVFEIKLDRKTGSFGNQVNLKFKLNLLSYKELYATAVLKFFDKDLNPYYHYIYYWGYDGDVDVWVNIPYSDVNFVYMVVSEQGEDQSDPEKVFLLFDDFDTTISGSGKWEIRGGDPKGFWFDSDDELEFEDFFKNSGLTDSEDYVWDINCSFLAWVYPTVVDGNDRCVFTDDNNNEGRLIIKSDQVRIEWGWGGDDLVIDIDIESYKWHHFTMIHEFDEENDSYIYRLYINGEEASNLTQDKSDITSEHYGPDSSLRVGYNFVGIIKEIQVYDYVLTEEEVQYYMETSPEEGESGLLAYYPLNVSTMEENIVHDQSGNEHDSNTFSESLLSVGLYTKDSKLVRCYGNNYIVSKDNIEFPCTIQQKFLFKDFLGESGKICGFFIDPYTEGIYFYYNDDSNTFDIHFNNQVESFYDPPNSLKIEEEGELSVGFSYNKIDYSFNNSYYNLSDSWAFNTYNGKNRTLKVFEKDDTVFETDDYGNYVSNNFSVVELDWIRVLNYGSDFINIDTFVTHSTLTDEVVYDFEEGNLSSEWEVYDSDFQIKTDNVYEGDFSVGIEDGDAPEDLALLLPEVLDGGKEITKFSFYWYETSSSTGGGIKVIDSYGNIVCGFASDNPQWVLDSYDGLEEIYDGDGYERWVYVEFVFNWADGTYDYYIKDLKSGNDEEGQKFLKHQTNVEKFIISEHDGRSWGGDDSIYMWFDNIFIGWDSGFLSQSVEGSLVENTFEGDTLEKKYLWVKEISSKAVKKNKINVLYGVDNDWTDDNINYVYEMDDGVYINDIFLTEGTSVNEEQHVIFIATSEGIKVIEENRGYENNSRVKYYKHT